MVKRYWIVWTPVKGVESYSNGQYILFDSTDKALRHIRLKMNNSPSAEIYEWKDR